MAKTYDNKLKRIPKDQIKALPQDSAMSETDALKLDAIKLRQVANDLSIKLARQLKIKCCQGCGRKI